MLRLRAGTAEAVIDPGLGAGVVALAAGGVAVLSTGTGRPTGPFAQGMNLLAPFSNRISAPFPWGGARHAVPPNLAGEAFAIHGDAFQKVWQVAAAGPDHARLTLRGGIGPFVYDAQVDYRLGPDALETVLVLTNRGEETLPFGGGFHPWFERHAETVLGFAAGGHWPEDARHLPATQAPVAPPPDWVFDPQCGLPARFINAGFSVWEGRAVIVQPQITVTLEAPGLSTLLVYSPGPAAPFVCVEPVSHPVDAHNLPGQPGLQPLAPGQELRMALRLAWTPNRPEEMR
jgi:aldose 1-epimerase